MNKKLCEMKFDNILFWLSSALLSFNGVFALNILAVLPYQGKSHFFVFEPYLKELARRGHNLTVISVFPQEKPIENYHDISLAEKTEVLINVLPMHVSYWIVIKLFAFIFEKGIDNCKVLLADEKVQNLWKTKQKFDLVIFEQFHTDCALGLAYKLDAPTIGLTSHMLLPWHYEQHGIPYNPSYVPFLYMEGGSKPSLYQRIERTIFHIIATNLYQFMSVSPTQNTLQQYFDDIPPLQELAREVNFTLLYTNFVLSGARLYPPSVKEVGGFHVAKPKELPKELKTFIEEAQHGVIYISFGSMLKPDLTPPEKVKAIVEAISQLPQRVIWKWDAELPSKPDNVYTAKWLPQNDILAHPNVLAFYSHCGMLGTTEAIYHGVPIIGMPVFGDQPGNAGAIEESGFGVVIPVRELTKDNLLDKFKTVLNPEFRKKVKELSRAWHDQPMSPMDAAVYWTEFAARNKNFTYTSPAATVPLYQYLFLDVILVLGGIMIIILVLLKYSLSFLVSKPQPKIKKIKTK